MSFPDIEEEELNANDASNPIIKDFIEEVLALAQWKANLSTKFTAKDILVASKLVLPSSMKRLKSGNVTTFTLALKEERTNAPQDVLEQQAGKKRNGGQGLDGRYAKWVQTQYDTPEKITYYREKAKKINEEAGSREPAGILDMKTYQARGLRDLESMVCSSFIFNTVLPQVWLMRTLQVVDLAARDIHIICLATTSEKVKPLLFRTGRPAENF